MDMNAGIPNALSRFDPRVRDEVGQVYCLICDFPQGQIGPCYREWPREMRMSDESGLWVVRLPENVRALVLTGVTYILGRQGGVQHDSAWRSVVGEAGAVVEGNSKVVGS